MKLVVKLGMKMEVMKETKVLMWVEMMVHKKVLYLVSLMVYCLVPMTDHSMDLMMEDSLVYLMASY